MESAPGIEAVSLANKKIILGVTGGIAAYKAAELCRLLIKAGADVRVVMTAAAQQFVTPLTFQALSGKPVLTSLWEAASGDGMEHIHLSRDADLLLVAPASADFLAKLVAWPGRRSAVDPVSRAHLHACRRARDEPRNVGGRADAAQSGATSSRRRERAGAGRG